jgi:glucose-6-phosphate 1-dehydrogenase
MSQTNANEQPLTIVIFGASGDLTRRKLVPALFNLFQKGRLPDNIDIVGFADTTYTHQEFRTHLQAGMKQFANDIFDAAAWNDFAARLWYRSGNCNGSSDYEQLDDLLNEVAGGPSHRVYYLATAPRFFTTIAEQLDATGMARQAEGWRRIVVEKPFGHDLASAQALGDRQALVDNGRQVIRFHLGSDVIGGLQQCSALLFSPCPV